MSGHAERSDQVDACRHVADPKVSSPRSPVSRGLIWVVRLYQTWVSPTRMPSCRFDPTCSAYAVEALAERGAVVGLLLSTKRLLRCGPWSRGGYDPVPLRR